MTCTGALAMMDQFTEPGPAQPLATLLPPRQRHGATLLLEPAGRMGAQILAVVEASSPVVQAKIEAVFQDAGLLRMELHKVAERSLYIEQDASKFQKVVASLCTERSGGVAKTEAMEAQAEDT
ncbi:hypothetical protein NDU88_007867 [Pleurodeles waltl]|uniref:Uncharacterized protein n=1 Tax=Pleurodeles waltl TaxID=8319 RepID=A0AAV7VUV8_PLEWA|nr:hypothetical protein NDU88_007867 [Pleurodeles waltl]